MRDGSVYLPQIDLWCDARRSVPVSFVSHAHSDHVARHRRIFASEATRRLMALRVPGKREEIVLPFGETYAFNAETELSLHPAGHILGSAMIRLVREGESFLYTGDFKLKPGRASEVCQPPQADVLVMETTFGLPRYIFPSSDKVVEDIVHFCRSTIEAGSVPILFAYSLGKGQEVLASLAGANLPVMLHPQCHKMTRLYEELGQVFPLYRAFTPTEVAGHVVICPPQAKRSDWLQKIEPRRTAMISGWAIDSGAVYRYQCDAAFPLSDHADYNELWRVVELVQPKRVYTVHGFVQEFARDLRARGVEALALGASNQLEMNLAGPSLAADDRF